MQEYKEELDEIIEKKLSSGVNRYKIKWKGFSIDECTWELEENLKQYNAELQAFNAKLKGKFGGKRKNKIKRESQENKGDFLRKKMKRLSRSTIELNQQKKQKFHSSIKHYKYKSNDFDDENEIYGNISIDKPLKVVSIIKKDNISSEIILEIEWKKKKNGRKPKNSKVKNSEMKKYAPAILCDFYEKNIKFPLESSKYKSKL